MTINPSKYRPVAETVQKSHGAREYKTGRLVMGGLVVTSLVLMGQAAITGASTLFFCGRMLVGIGKRKGAGFVAASGTAFLLSAAGLLNAAHHSYWAQAYFAKAYARHDALVKIAHGKNDGEGLREFTYQPLMGWWRSEKSTFTAAMQATEEPVGVLKIAVRENGQAKGKEFYTVLGDEMYRVRLTDGIPARRKAAVVQP